MTNANNSELFPKTFRICKFTLVRKAKDRILEECGDIQLRLKFRLNELWERFKQGRSRTFFTEQECECLGILVFLGIDEQHPALLEEVYVSRAFDELEQKGNEKSFYQFLRAYLMVSDVRGLDSLLVARWKKLAHVLKIKLPWESGLFERDPEHWIAQRSLATTEIRPFEDLFLEWVDGKLSTQGWFYNQACVHSYYRYAKWIDRALAVSKEIDRVFETIELDVLKANCALKQPDHLDEFFDGLLTPLNPKTRTRLPSIEFQHRFKAFVEKMLGQYSAGHYPKQWARVKVILDNWALGDHLNELFEYLNDFDEEYSGECEHWKDRGNFWYKLWRYGFILDIELYVMRNRFSEVPMSLRKAGIVRTISQNSRKAMILFHMSNNVYISEISQNGSLRMYLGVPGWTKVKDLDYSKVVNWGTEIACIRHTREWRQNVASKLDSLLDRTIPRHIYEVDRV